MNRAVSCVVVLVFALAAGCAGNRETVADTPATAAAPTLAAAAATPAGQTDAAGGVTVVDGNQLAQRSADTLLCRDLLVRGSNVQRRMCGTAAEWKVYERREAQAAGEMVRRMQQGRPADLEYPSPRRR
jgi:hypothetical protein